MKRVGIYLYEDGINAKWPSLEVAENETRVKLAPTMEGLLDTS